MQIISTTAAARKMGIDPRTFRRLAQEPGFPRPIGGRWWSVDAIEAWLNNTTAPGEEFDAVEQNYQMICEVLYGTATEI